MRMVELSRTILDQKEAGTYVSPIDGANEQPADQTDEEESEESEENDLSYLGPLADLGPIPDANADDSADASGASADNTSEMEAAANHADEV